MENTVNPVKALDISEALALNCIPEDGIIASGDYKSSDSFRYEITEYTGLKNVCSDGRSVTLDAISMNQTVMNISGGRILSRENRNIHTYRTPDQTGRNFSFVFFPGPETEKRVESFTEKLLRYREAKK